MAVRRFRRLPGNGLSGNAVKEAVEALVALGYTNAEAAEGVKERQCDGRDGFRGGIEGITEISGVFVKQPMCRTFEIAGS